MAASTTLGILIFAATGGEESDGGGNGGSDFGLAAFIVMLALVFPVLAWRRTSVGRPIEGPLWRGATITGVVLLTTATTTMTATILTSPTMVVIGGILAAGWYLAYVSARVGNLTPDRVAALSEAFLMTSSIWAIAGLLASAFLVVQAAVPDDLEAVRGVYIDSLTGATIFLVPTTVALHARIRRAERGLPDRLAAIALTADVDR